MTSAHTQIHPDTPPHSLSFTLHCSVADYHDTVAWVKWNFAESSSLFYVNVETTQAVFKSTLSSWNNITQCYWGRCFKLNLYQSFLSHIPAQQALAQTSAAAQSAQASQAALAASQQVAAQQTLTKAATDAANAATTAMGLMGALGMWKI